MAEKKPKGGLIRWKLLIVVVGLLALFLFFGLGPIAAWSINRYGPEMAGEPVHVDGVSVNPIGGRMTLTGFTVGEDPTKPTLAADEASVDLDLYELVRGRIVGDELKRVRPRGRIVRDEDGSINIEKVGKQPPPERRPGEDEGSWRRRIEEEAKKRDWVKQVQEWLKRRKERQKEEEAEKAEKKRQEEEKRLKRDPEAAAADIYPEEPFIVIRRIVAEDVEITFEDALAKDQPPAKIEKGHLEILERSSDPSLHGKTTTNDLKAKFAGAVASDLSLGASLDPRADAQSGLKLDADFPAAAFDSFYKDSIPFKFGAKTIAALVADLKWTSKGVIDLKPETALKAIEAVARDPAEKLFGVDAKTIATELTNMGEFDFGGIRIFGPIESPNVDLQDVPDMLKKLALMGARNYAEKELGKQLDTQSARLREEAAKALGDKVPVPEGAEKVLDGAGEKVKEGAGAVIDSIFGPKKQDKDK